MVPSLARTWRTFHRISQNLPLLFARCTSFEGEHLPLAVNCKSMLSHVRGQGSIRHCQSRSVVHHSHDGTSKDSVGEEEPEFYTPVSIESAEHEALLLAHPSALPEDARASKVAIIGTPNAGKSTLINSLLGRRICAVSQKVHTTRSKTLAVITHKNTQVVLLDTPGMISFSAGRRHKLPRSLLVDAKNTLLEADLITVLVDVSNRWTNMKLDPEVLLQLHTHPEIPSILVLNKVDALQSKQSLFEITESLTEGVVDGKDFVSPRRKRKSENRQDSQTSLRTAESSDSAENTKENMPGIQEAERSYQEVSVDSLQRTGEDQMGIPLSESARSHKMEGFPLLSGKGPHDTSSPLHHHTTSGTEMHGDCQGSHPANQVVNHMTSGNTGRSGDLDPVKADILKQYASNLMEFVNLSDKDVLNTVRAVDENAEAVARQQRTEEMERQREERRKLWRTAKEKNGWPGFKAVYMISALRGDGVQDLKEFLVDNARPGDWEYHEDVVTNLTPEEIVRDAIREKLLESLPQEVPYNISQSTDLWQTGEGGELIIVQTLICKKKSHVRMLEKKLGWIARCATQDLMDAFHCEVNLRLHLKLSK